MSNRQTRARRALLDSATRLLSENPGASFMQIAQAAGVGRATLYRHFPTREDLIHTLSIEAVEATHAVIHEKTREAANYTEALLKTMEAIIPMGDQYNFLTRLPEVSDSKITNLIREQSRDLKKLIKKAQEEGGLDASIPASWATSVFNSLVYAAWHKLDREGFDKDTLVQLAITTLKQGLGAQTVKVENQLQN